MTAALISLFLQLAKTLDDVILKVDGDLPLAEDIHPAIRKVGEFAAERIRLPVALAKLKAQKASAESSVPARDQAVRKAKHATKTLEDKLKKLGERIDHNRNVLTLEDEKPAAKTSPNLLGGKALPTRKDIIEGLHKEILACEDELAAAKDALKRTEAFRKGVTTRIENLAAEIAATERAIAVHEARLDETVRVLRKTITHLRNRQEKRDRKRGKSVTVPGFENPDGSPIEFVDARLEPLPKSSAPTDEDIRKMCEEAGMPIESPEDIAAARALFC